MESIGDKAFGGSSTIQGSAFLLRLMRRVLHVDGQTPAAIEYSFTIDTTDPGRTRTNEMARVNAMIADAISGATRKPKEAMMRRNDITGILELAPLLTSDRADLWRACQSMANVLDQQARQGKRAETTWYPDGWREAYDLAKQGRRAQEAAE